MPNWSTKEIEYLCKNDGKMTNQEMADALHKTLRQVKSKKYALRLAAGHIRPPENQVKQKCESCQNTNQYKCSWFQLPPTPVKGWTAEKSKIYKDGYFIIDCPNFKPIPPREICHLDEVKKPEKVAYDRERLLYMVAKHWKHEEIARAFNVSVRTVERWIANERTGKTKERKVG